MSIKVNVDGTELVGYTKVTVERGFKDSCGQFSLTVSLNDKNNVPQFDEYPIKIGSSIQILVEEQPFLTGFVDSNIVNQSSNSLMIGFSGRDRTEDVVDSTISKSQVDGFLGNISLENISKSVVKSLGITDIDVINLTGDDLFFQKNEFIMPTEGEPAMEFLQKLAEIKGVFMNTDGLGNIQIVRGGNSKSEIKTKLLNEIEGNNNNILQSSSRVDYSKRYNQYIAYSQQSSAQASLSGKRPTAKDLYSPKSDDTASIDRDIRPSRVYNFIANMPLDEQGLETRATWENSLRRAGAIKYSCMVQGYTYDGKNIWEPNILVNLVDEYAKINANMLVDHIRFVESTENVVTHLSLVSADSYELEAQLTRQQRQTQVIAQGYISG